MRGISGAMVISVLRSAPSGNTMSRTIAAGVSVASSPGSAEG